MPPVPTGMPSVPQQRVWRPSWPCAVGQILGGLRHGGGDPTYRRDPDGTVWRGIRTPHGPATLRVAARPSDGEVAAEAWGPGAAWVLDSLPAMLGEGDDVTGFEAHHHAPVADAWRRHPHWRVPRTGLVMETLVPTVLEQRVTGQEGFGSWRALVLRHGERAPGAGGERGVWLSPSAATLRRVPSWEWLRLRVDPGRSRTIVAAASVAPALERTVGLAHEEADRRLRTLPGMGVWTSAEIRQRVHGDPDALSVGDYHVAKDITWALTGTPRDDAVMLELLECYRPHRHRVQALLALAGHRRPRRAPRMSLPTHLPG